MAQFKDNVLTTSEPQNAEWIAEARALRVKANSSPLHRIIDQLLQYHRALVVVHHAKTDQARLEALDVWHSSHSAVWESSPSNRNDTIRSLADPAKAWLSRINSQYVAMADFNLVEESVRTLSAFAISHSPMAMPDIYSKKYHSDEELWRKWNKQGDQITELDNLIVRLKELAARAGDAWVSNTPRKLG